MSLRLLFLSILCVLTASCVSTKVYQDLRGQYEELQDERNSLTDSLQEIDEANNRYENELKLLQRWYDDITADNNQLQQDQTALKSNLTSLQASYDLLERNRNSEIVRNASKNKELLQLLDEKQDALDKESNRLEELNNQLGKRSEQLNQLKEKLSTYSKELEDLRYNLYQRSRKVKQLKGLISEKNKALDSLKTKISQALLDFEGNGLSIKQRNGKIYVSMESQLLFGSGSSSINSPQGQKAVQELGKVLAKNPSISVLIEGHTDDVPLVPNAKIKDNWDLSAKRATSVVQMLLKNTKIKPKNITAAGRSQYAPIAENDTAIGRAKNRRIEVILTPKLDEVMELLNTKDTTNEIHDTPTDQPQSK